MAAPRRLNIIALPSLKGLDRSKGRVGHQLAQALRNAIAKGELKGGERLPSTRALSESLGLARGTIVEVFDQLYAEGYLESRARSGTVVAHAPDEMNAISPAVDGLPTTAKNLPVLPANVERLNAVYEMLEPQGPLPFAIAHPAGEVAPDDKWRRLGNRVRASRISAPTGYVDPRGLPELRSAIADYVRKSRAVKCDADQVIITSGTQQGLFLSATVLFSDGDAVWVEDPAYPGILAVLGNFNTTVHRIPVDAQGIDVEQGIAACPNAKVAFVTPSHQYPLGMPLSMRRRSEILMWARQNNSWIVEDDYDSELRYAGHPFPSLQGLDPERVIYLGTMSKMMFSSMRIGYAVLPKALVQAFAGARALIDRHSPTAEQHVLAQYMREGFFEAHIRRIRNVYSERRSVLIEALQKELPSWATLQPSDQGMHLVLWLPLGMDDVRISQMAKKAGLVVRPISPMYAATPAKFGLALGFGGFSPQQIQAGVVRLKEVLEASLGSIKNLNELTKPDVLDVSEH